MDLYVGGEIGQWAVQNTDHAFIDTIFVRDGEELMSYESIDLDVQIFKPKDSSARKSATAISVHFPIVLDSIVLNAYRDVYNLHPGMLPYGRGYYPIFWALWEGSPAGATLHKMVRQVDAGPIVAQMDVPYSDSDTGETLFHRVRNAEKQLYLQYVTKIACGTILDLKDQVGIGSYHSKQDFLDIKSGKGIDRLAGVDVLRLIRCLSFPGYTGLEIREHGEVRSYEVKSIV